MIPTIYDQMLQAGASRLAGDRTLGGTPSEQEACLDDADAVLVGALPILADALLYYTPAPANTAPAWMRDYLIAVVRLLASEERLSLPPSPKSDDDFVTTELDDVQAVFDLEPPQIKWRPMHLDPRKAPRHA